VRRDVREEEREGGKKIAVNQSDEGTHPNTTVRKYCTRIPGSKSSPESSSLGVQWLRGGGDVRKHLFLAQLEWTVLENKHLSLPRGREVESLAAPMYVRSGCRVGRKPNKNMATRFWGAGKKVSLQGAGGPNVEDAIRCSG